MVVTNRKESGVDIRHSRGWNKFHNFPSVGVQAVRDTVGPKKEKKNETTKNVPKCYFSSSTVMHAPSNLVFYAARTKKKCTISVSCDMSIGALFG